MRVAVLIYGIGRSSIIVDANFRSKLYPILTASFNIVDTFYVYNHVGSLNNPRTNEFSEIVPPKTGVFKNAKIIKTCESDLLDPKILEKTLACVDVHNDDYRTYKNLLSQLSMLKIMTDIPNIESYDRLLVIRDDTIIKNNLSIKFLSSVYDNYILLTYWHWHNGLSDRFLYGSPDRVIPCLHRLDLVEEFIDKFGYLNGEQLVRFLFKKDGLSFLVDDIQLVRVRAHMTHVENFIPVFWRPLELFRVIVRIIFSKFIRFFYENYSFWRSSR